MSVPSPVPIYLDHASTSWPKASGVAQAMVRALDLPGTPRRGVGPGARDAQQIDDDLRRALADIIHAEDPRRVILTGGATASLNMAIAGVVAAAKSRGVVRPRVVTTQIEHNAVRRPLLALHSRGEIDLEIVPASQDTLVSPLLAAIEAQQTGDRPPADLVAMTWVSNVTGAIQPVGQVAAALRGSPTMLLVDGSQAAGLVRSRESLERTGIDLVAFSGHKALGGPAGVGALYIGPRAHPLAVGASRGGGGDALRAVHPEPSGASIARVLPTTFGGTGSHSLAEDMPSTLPERFEAGTPATPARAGLLGAIREIAPAAEALAHVQGLGAMLRTALAEIAGVTLLGPGDPRSGVGIVGFNCDGFSPDEVATILDAEFGIIVRAGLHCAPGAHEAMGTIDLGGAVRASVGSTTTAAEVEALASAVRAIGGD